MKKKEKIRNGKTKCNLQIQYNTILSEWKVLYRSKSSVRKWIKFKMDDAECVHNEPEMMNDEILNIIIEMKNESDDRNGHWKMKYK